LSPLLLLAAIFGRAPDLAIAVAVMIGLVLVRWRGWQRTFYTLDSDRLLVRTGWWRRRTVILPLARIQSIDLTETFVSRWFGTSTLAFGVAGGSGFSAHVIPALKRETARVLRTQLLVSQA
jgi:putative membrane protein